MTSVTPPVELQSAAATPERGSPPGASTASAVPPVYAVRMVPPGVGMLGRLTAFGIAAGCLVVLVLAAGITPSASGMGSHTRLGLQPCGFLKRTGLPCLSCGYTTSFAWFARGNVAASAYVQPAGALAAFMAAGAVWIGFYVAITGRPAHRLLLLVPGRVWLIGLLGFAVLAWGWKVWIHLEGLDGWSG